MVIDYDQLLAKQPFEEEHGSGGNSTDGFRQAYILAFRPESTVKIERELGFTHSHNDEVQVLDNVGVEGQSK